MPFLSSHPSRRQRRPGKLMTVPALLLLLLAAPADARAAEARHDRPPAPRSAFHERFEDHVIRLVNLERHRAGCGPVRANRALRRAARRHSAAMARSGRLAHRGARLSTPGRRALAAGYSWQRLGETLGRGYTAPAGMVAAWMDSPPHRRVLLNCAYQDTGVGVVAGEDGLWWAQSWGRRTR